MKTYQPKAKDVKRNWHIVDARDRVLGRLATMIANLLTGKNKTAYATHLDMGDNVVVINAEKIKLTGRKTSQKVYRRHSGYPGGFKEVSFREMLAKKPTFIVKSAVAGMLPDNRLKKERMARLKIVVGEENPFANKFAEDSK